jgi:ParB family chromosome partitioning protein
LRHLTGETVDMTDTERASYDALKAEYDRLEEQHADADEIPDEIDQRPGEIETAVAAFDERPVVYDPAGIARAGVFVSIDSDGELRIERGYVRPEDDAPAPAEPEGEDPTIAGSGSSVHRTVVTIGGGTTAPDAEAPEEEDSIRPLSDRLMTELTAHRTLALRNAVAGNPDVAFAAVLHTLCLSAFYRYATDTCLEITAKSAGFGIQAPGLNDTHPRRPSRHGTSPGGGSCRRSPPTSGTRSSGSMTSARWRCSPIAPR